MTIARPERSERLSGALRLAQGSAVRLATSLAQGSGPSSATRGAVGHLRPARRCRSRVAEYGHAPPCAEIPGLRLLRRQPSSRDRRPRHASGRARDRIAWEALTTIAHGRAARRMGDYCPSPPRVARTASVSYPGLRRRPGKLNKTSVLRETSKGPCEDALSDPLATKKDLLAGSSKRNDPNRLSVLQRLPDSGTGPSHFDCRTRGIRQGSEPSPSSV